MVATFLLPVSWNWLYKPQGWVTTLRVRLDLAAKEIFVTAPEISPLFSKCLARQCRQVLQKLENPPHFFFKEGSKRRQRVGGI